MSSGVQESARLGTAPYADDSMKITIDSAQPVVHEADDLKSLSVRVAAGAPTAAALGIVDDDGAHVWIPVERLREMAAATIVSESREAWQVEFDNMIRYASSKGWVGSDGTTVRAHITVED